MPDNKKLKLIKKSKTVIQFIALANKVNGLRHSERISLNSSGLTVSSPGLRKVGNIACSARMHLEILEPLQSKT